MSDRKRIDWSWISDDRLKSRIKISHDRWEELYMAICDQSRDGYYDDNGHWQRTKFCFVYCGPDRCTCSPPLGIREHKQVDSELPIFIQPKDEDDKKGP